jgi:hypothetical protein
VVGKVALSGVVPHRPPPPRHGDVEMEWQARHGSIAEFRLLDTNGAPDAMTHANELSARYGAPVDAM